ncbi:MAG: MarR family transcriptional regulator [Gammaproteobacteria bacterium]|nr:MarR family transcriptional regulator [Gammaproteobacteria bacterium]
MHYLSEEGGLTQKELSKRVHVKESTIVAVIQEMEDIGLIKRIRTHLDRQKYSLSHPCRSPPVR